MVIMIDSYCDACLIDLIINEVKTHVNTHLQVRHYNFLVAIANGCTTLAVMMKQNSINQASIACSSTSCQ